MHPFACALIIRGPLWLAGRCLSAETGNKRFKTAIPVGASTSQPNLHLCASALEDAILVRFFFFFRQFLIIHTHQRLHVLLNPFFLFHFQATVSELKRQMVNLHQQLLEKQVGNNCVHMFARVYYRLDKVASYISFLCALFIRVAHVQSVWIFLLLIICA